MPKFISMSLDPRCNLKCPQCRDDFCNLSEAEGLLLKLELARINESGWLSSACMSIAGLGEVFFSPVYRELLFNAYKKREEVYIKSNGLLFTENELKKLVSIYDSINISISVDAATSDTYRKIRGGNFDVLLKNLKDISAYRQNGKVKSFELTFCAQKANIKEIPSFIQLSHQLNVDSIKFQKIHMPRYMSKEMFKDYSLIKGTDIPFEELVCLFSQVDVEDPIIDWYQLSDYVKKYKKNLVD